MPTSVLATSGAKRSELILIAVIPHVWSDLDIAETLCRKYEEPNDNESNWLLVTGYCSWMSQPGDPLSSQSPNNETNSLLGYVSKLLKTL